MNEFLSRLENKLHTIIFENMDFKNQSASETEYKFWRGEVK